MDPHPSEPVAGRGVSVRLTAALALLVSVGVAEAQWTNRYPKLEGYSHHVYAEGYELPIFAAGPTDPAPSPDGTGIAFAARGWLWLLDETIGIARRLTSGAAVDSRPAWRPDGGALAFLRDDGRSLSIRMLDMTTGEERLLFADDSIVLDPAWAPDGASLYFSAATAGDLDIWRLSVETGEPVRLSDRRGLEVRPQPLLGGALAYLAKGRSAPDAVVVRNSDGAETILRAESIASQARPAASPDGMSLAVNWPAGDGGEGYKLMLLDPAGGDAIQLAAARGLPLAPVFSADGESVLYAEADETERFRLKRVGARGGPVEEIAIRGWEYGVPTGRARITTRASGHPVAARLAVRDGAGHPAVPGDAAARFDGTHGRIYFYSPGVIELELPVEEGEARVLATHGFAHAPATAGFTVRAGETVDVELALEPLWDARAAGYRSGDLHFHLNYGGPMRLDPEDLTLLLKGEDLDIGTPLMANLHHRLNDAEFFAARRLAELPAFVFGQEVRSHFLGHLGLVGIESAFQPWFWGPGYPVFADDDRPNADALAHARREGGVSSYMHPVSVADPFTDAGLSSIPIHLIPDAVLGDLDTLEIACLWTSELGTAAVWERILTLGIPLAASAGTDVMLDFHRTMAVGTTRIYVEAPGPFRLPAWLDALKAGRSFVTTGPLLDFRVGGMRPGDATPPGEAAWTLEIASSGPVERVEILVNGQVVETLPGLEGPGSARREGSLTLPEGGFVAARARGGEEAWPGMNGSVFAQTSPIWIGKVGSHDPAAASRAAADLLRALDVAELRVAQRYGDTPVPRIRARFAAARERLAGFLR